MSTKDAWFQSELFTYSYMIVRGVKDVASVPLPLDWDFNRAKEELDSVCVGKELLGRKVFWYLDQEQNVAFLFGEGCEEKVREAFALWKSLFNNHSDSKHKLPIHRRIGKLYGYSDLAADKFSQHVYGCTYDRYISKYGSK